MKKTIAKFARPLSRRSLVQGAATGTLGLSSLPLFAPLVVSQAARANALAAGSAHPVIQICLIDKVQQALFLATQGAIGAGDLNGLDGGGLSYDGDDLVGQALPANTVNFRGMELTALFGERLREEMSEEYSLAIFPQFTSRSGGHSLQNTDIGPEIGGLNYLIDAQGEGTGMLGYVGFNIRADANASRESAVAPGRIPLPTYDSVAQIRSTLKNSIAPLDSPHDVLAFHRTLDRLATPGDGLMDSLLAIKDRINPVLPALLEAMTAPDIVRQQLQAIIALAQAGLSSNFMLAIPWDDTNGGGNLSNGGGSARIAPITGAAMLADVYTTLSRELPSAVTVVVSDGGRSRDNGDAAGGISMITGPADLINNGVFGRTTALEDLGSTNRIAQNGADIPLSDGTTTRILEHKHLLALVAKVVHGIDTGTPYPIRVSTRS